MAATADRVCALVGKPAGGGGRDRPGQAGVAHGAGRRAAGAVRLDDDGRLVIPPLTAEDVPAEAKALRDEPTGMLPFAPITSLLIELDGRPGRACNHRRGSGTWERSPWSATTPTVTNQRYRHAGPLLTARWNQDLVRECPDDLLRMAASLKYGQATASLIVGK